MPVARALAVVLLASGTAHAQALTAEAAIAYQHASGGDAAAHAVTGELRVRILAGRRLAPCLGVDGGGGLAGGEAVWGGTVYPLGIGLRYGRTSAVALCAGAGARGVAGESAWTIPVELFWEGTGAFAVARPLAAVRVVRVIDVEDELHALLGLRVILPDERAPEIAIGDGLYLGVTYDQALGARIFGVALGYAIATHH